MKRSEHGMGTIRALRCKATGEVTGYQALLPRELSQAPRGRKVSSGYKEPLGPPQPTWEDARSLLDAAIVELRDKVTLRHGKTFALLADAEIQGRLQAARRKYKNDALASRQVASARSMIKRWLQDGDWFNFPIHVIETADIQATIDYLRDEAEGHRGEPLGNYFIRDVGRFICAVFKRARIKPNPAADISLPPKGEPSVRYLDLDAQVRLYRSEDDRITLADQVMTGCGMGAGLRVGELLSMEPADVHVEAIDPHLMVRYGGPHRSPTKGKRIRRVELFEPGLGFWRMQMREFFRPGSRLVFAGPEDGYRKHWPEQFPGWAPLAGVERLSSHIMRHTYAVALLSGTWGYEPRSLEFVSQQLGHADLQTTQRYYAAFEADTWRREVRRMTGREAPSRAGASITAEWLLGREAGAKLVRQESAFGRNSASSVPHGINSRQSPSFQDPPRKSVDLGEIGAAAHQSSPTDLAKRVIDLAASGDGGAFQCARELAERVLASREFTLAQEVLAGGPHALTRAIDLAQAIMDGHVEGVATEVRKGAR